MKRDEIRIPALEELMDTRFQIPHWTGDVMRDHFAFLHYEVSALNYRLNRADVEGARMGLERCRAYLDSVERDLLPPMEKIAERDATDLPPWVRQ